MGNQINLSEGNVLEAAENIGDVVRVFGPTKGGAADMVGFLSGITFTAANIIVVMEHGQTTTFSRNDDSEDVFLEILPVHIASN